MKHKLINIETKETHLCDKVTLDGFDYYLSDEPDYSGGWHIDIEFKFLSNPSRFNVVDKMRKVIATNNPNIDCAKVVEVVDEVWEFEKEYFKNRSWGSVNPINQYKALRAGYNKAKETHPFSEEDIIEFYKWVNQPHPEDNRQPSAVYVKNINMWWYNHKKYTSKELLQLWKEQKIKTIYFN